MPTRHADNQDVSHAPERNLSSLHNRSLTISLAIAANACRRYPKESREACLWLANVAANSQRIQLCWQMRFLPDPIGAIGRITEAELCEKVGLHRSEVYAALTGHEDADLGKFVEKVSLLRKEFESQLPPLVTTADSKSITEAFTVAGEQHRIAVIQGKTRHGKTEECQRKWLKNLHRCVWLRCPSDNQERTFLDEFARALGVYTNISKKPAQLRQQIKRALGIGLIDTVVIDEAHFLWPTNLVTQKPARAELVRELRDELGVGFVLVTTDQFATAMEICKAQNTRYAPGQIAGRRYQFELRDSHTDKELRAILTLHAGSITDEAVEGLLDFVKTEEGYLGAGIEAIVNARIVCGNHGAPINATHVAVATKQQQTAARVKQLALTAKPVRRRRVKLLAA